ncbi:MAG: sugar phosphate isomerase/epimerase family protein [Thermogutta sp.]|nr:sugar phosphate isomerase/epimerase family protein [Thermogutta sp.]HPU04894.1 sugar phosphate isomerase/epimerase family protein [Thermogutta sp.]HPZ83628.1 sugar phosphate isomerase/epimerase family protein [Thermogutta sp.]HQF14559.1 sugar phosphate isomerase/epimerase family protein [Thermogutta sp.]
MSFAALSRRRFGQIVAGAASVAVFTCEPLQAKRIPEVTSPLEAFRFCLNTATIRAQRLPLAEEIDLAAKVGYHGIEPWTREIEEYISSGGKLADLRKRLQDRGLSVESAIGFPTWMVDDDTQRAKGFEQMKREMDWIAQLGGTRIAAPPAGAYNSPPIDLRRVAERYAQLLDLGHSMGVVPQLEIWGASANLSRLSEAAFVLVECGHPDASALFDVFHIYRSGSPVAGLRVFNGRNLHVFHMNDYPADPPREKIRDSDRVFPGDGVAPLSTILQILAEIGFQGTLSLELFNPEYAKMTAEEVAQTGLAKMKNAVLTAFQKESS